jgi:hypothetical protein
MIFYLLQIHGDVDPELHGPFKTQQERDDKARALRRDDPEKENGLYRVAVWLPAAGEPPDVSVAAYGGYEL